jgi:DNA mismatch repair protein MutS2
MNAHALQVLQFPEALELVAKFAASPLGADAVRALEPSDARVWVDAELRRVDQMAAFLLASQDWVAPAVPDLRAPLRMLAVEGSVWDGAALRDAGELLRSARGARRALLRLADDYPLLAEVANRLLGGGEEGGAEAGEARARRRLLEAEEQAIRRAIDEAGHVRDEATPELARLRREIRAARLRIVERLEQYMASLPDRIRVADASVSVRDGRYVIPVRREGRGEVGGIVHDESASGNTLFVEPPVAIELMNRLRELELSEAREVQRILRELTQRLRPHREVLEITLDALITIDSLYARARYALEYNGRRPEILPRGSGEYVVVRGYHPLLLAGPDPVVPFDLALESDERTLLVSGPNTGGKTVLLKAIGLISVMAQAGIIPPVGAGTRLPLFGNVFADIGDEQSIEASLSTFSAHLKNLREIVEHADADTLALIDEIGSGTDPVEGGALARAILVELTRRGTRTVATTHLGQLKLLAGAEPGVVNASLQFDSRELKPTYRLVKGIPGRSYGLAIARGLGFPADVLERAESYQPESEREVGQLLVELEEKERRAAEALAEAEAAREELVTLRRQVEQREHEVRKRERDAERRARQQARDLLLGAREEVEAAIRELRETLGAAVDAAAFEEAARTARRRVEQAARKQLERTPELAAEAGAAGLAPARAPEPGDRVRIAATGAVGTVVEVRDSRATVEAGGVRLQVPLTGLVALEPEEAEAQARRAPIAGLAAGWSAPEAEARPEVDLRGLRAEEAAGEVERAVDAAARAELTTLRIIHGKGTGALREVVAETLRTDRRVKGFRPGAPAEGGTGVTIAELA